MEEESSPRNIEKMKMRKRLRRESTICSCKSPRPQNLNSRGSFNWYSLSLSLSLSSNFSFIFEHGFVCFLLYQLWEIRSILMKSWFYFYFEVIFRILLWYWFIADLSCVWFFVVALKFEFEVVSDFASFYFLFLWNN